MGPKRYVVFGLAVAGLTILAICYTNLRFMQHISQQKVPLAFTVPEALVVEASEQQLEKQLDQAAANHQTELARLASFSSSLAVPHHPDQKLEARMAELEARFEVRL